jgi:hypothetical protein
MGTVTRTNVCGPKSQTLVFNFLPSVAAMFILQKQTLYCFWNLVTIAIDISSNRYVNLKFYSRVASDYLQCKSSGVGDFQPAEYTVVLFSKANFLTYQSEHVE